MVDLGLARIVGERFLTWGQPGNIACSMPKSRRWCLEASAFGKDEVICQGTRHGAAFFARTQD